MTGGCAGVSACVGIGGRGGVASRRGCCSRGVAAHGRPGVVGGQRTRAPRVATRGAAGGDQGPSVSMVAEDAAFLGKVVVSGFAGGALIKYGEAMLPVVDWTGAHPQAAAALALTSVFGVPLFYAWTLASGRRDPPQ